MFGKVCIWPALMVLAADRPAFADRSMDYEAIAEVLMPIRIKRHDKTLPEPQGTADERVMASAIAVSRASYTGGKMKLRILCGSI